MITIASSNNQNIQTFHLATNEDNISSNSDVITSSITESKPHSQIISDAYVFKIYYLNFQ